MSHWLASIDRRFPQVAFARHIPISQMLFRLKQRILRQLYALRQSRSLSGATRLWPIACPINPPFAPRAINAQHIDNIWHFTFIGRQQEMPGEIDWRSPSMHRDDQLWRMNLHYMEYLESLSPDDGAAAIRQWISANPLSRDGATSDAWNAYALSIRVVCWLQWLAKNPNCDARLRREIEQSLTSQIGYLERHLERDIGGNHLIKNIKALLWAAACFDGPDAMRWGRVGRALLRSEMAKQILPDAVHYERSPSYHAQVTADLIEIAFVLPFEEQAAIWPTLSKMVEASVALSHGDGRAAQFNDSGLSMAYAPAQIVAAARAIGLSVSDERRSTAFADAGFLAWHDGDDSLIAKVGAIAPDSLPAHGHGDIGSFELSIAAQRIIVDQGVHEYIAGAKRAASRSTASHNVTQVGDFDHADFFGEFRMGWRCHPAPPAFSIDGRTAQVSVRHDAFDRHGGCGTVRRTVKAAPGAATIFDLLDHGADEPVVSRLLLHPGVEIDLGDGGAKLTIGATVVDVQCDATLTVEDAIWWPDMGYQMATRRLIMQWPDGSTDMTTILNWQDQETL